MARLNNRVTQALLAKAKCIYKLYLAQPRADICDLIEITYPELTIDDKNLLLKTLTTFLV